MPFALGRHLLFREIFRGGWVAVAAVIAIIVLLIYWPRIAGWIERRLKRR